MARCKPFTAADVKSTLDYDRQRRREDCAPIRARAYQNVGVTTTADYELCFTEAPAAGVAVLLCPVIRRYPSCVAQADRLHPSHRPFKFVEYKPKRIHQGRAHPDYWKPGRPYLSMVSSTHHPPIGRPRCSPFIAGKFDMPSRLKCRSDAEGCAATKRAGDLRAGARNASANLIVNRDLRRSTTPSAASYDARPRPQELIDILAEGKGDIGGAMQPPPPESGPAAPTAQIVPGTTPMSQRTAKARPS